MLGASESIKYYGNNIDLLDYTAKVIDDIVNFILQSLTNNYKQYSSLEINEFINKNKNIINTNEYNHKFIYDSDLKKYQKDIFVYFKLNEIHSNGYKDSNLLTELSAFIGYKKADYFNNQSQYKFLKPYFLKYNINFFSFLDTLENVLKKQIILEDKYLQDKSPHRGMMDELKIKYKDANGQTIDILLKDLPEKILIDESSNKILSFETNDYISKYRSFFEILKNKWYDILYYFKIFPNEISLFFQINNTNQDFNKIKNNFIKIISFGIQNNNFYNLNSIASNLSYLYPNDINSENVSLFISYFKDKDLGSKSETLYKLKESSRLLHNHIGDKEIILNSKYFIRSYEEKINTIISIALSGKSTKQKSNINLIETLYFIKNKKPNLIPNGYFKDSILSAISYVNNNYFNSNHLDEIINILLEGNYSENIRIFKFLIKLISEYSLLNEWMEKAKPKVEGVFEPSFSTNSFRFRVLGDLDPYHFSVGIDTNCCQAIGGVGESAAIDSYINPTAGVVVLEVKQDSEWELAAQSYFHYVEIPKENSGEIQKAIILDNIEAGRFKETYERKFGKDFYPKAYAILGSYLKNKGFDIVGCGKKFTYVIDDQEFEISSLDKDPRHFEVELDGIGRYTDFNSKGFYDLLNPKFSFEMPKDIGSIENEMTIKSSMLIEMIMIKKGFNVKANLIKLSRWLNRFGFKKEGKIIINIAQ